MIRVQRHKTTNGQCNISSGTETGMYTELQRLRHVIALQGGNRAREWARFIASTYLGLSKNTQHYASQPEWKSVFERSARELNQFADAEVFPPELEEPASDCAVQRTEVVTARKAGSVSTQC